MKVSYSKDLRQRQKERELPMVTIDLLSVSGYRVTFQGIVSEKAFKLLDKTLSKIIDMKT